MGGGEINKTKQQQNPMNTEKDLNKMEFKPHEWEYGVEYDVFEERLKRLGRPHKLYVEDEVSRNYAVEWDEGFDYDKGLQIEGSELEKRWKKTKGTFVGQYAAKEYEKIMELRKGKPAKGEVGKWESKSVWRAKKVDELKQIRKERKTFEKNFGALTYDVCEHQFIGGAINYRNSSNADRERDQLEREKKSKFKDPEQFRKYKRSYLDYTSSEFGYWDARKYLDKANNTQYLMAPKYQDEMEEKDLKIYTRLTSLYYEIMDRDYLGTGFVVDENYNVDFKATEKEWTKDYEVAKELIKAVKGLDLPDNLKSIYADKLTESMGTRWMTARVFLENIVSTALYNFLNTVNVPREGIDTKFMSRLLAMKTLSERALDVMINSAAFDEKVEKFTTDADTMMLKKDQEIYDAQKNEENRAKAIADIKAAMREKKNYVVDGSRMQVNQKVFDADDLPEEYIDKAVDLAVKEYESKRGKYRFEPADAEAINKRAITMGQFVYQNRMVVRSYIKKDLGRYTHKMEVLEQKLEKALLDEVVNQNKAFESKMERQELDVIFNSKECKNIQATFNEYTNRIMQVRNSIGDDLSKEALDEFMKSNENLFLDDSLSKEKRKELCTNFRMNIIDNQNILKEIVEKKVSGYSYNKYYETVLKNVGPVLATASPLQIRLVAENSIRYIDLNASQFGLSKDEQEFKDACKKSNIPEKYWNAIGRNLSEALGANSVEDKKKFISDALKDYKQRIQENRTMYLNVVNSYTLLRSDWDYLEGFVDRIVLMDRSRSEELKAAIVKKCESLQKKNSDAAITYDQYQNFQFEHKIVEEDRHKEKGHFEERLDGQDLASWSFLDDALAAIYKDDQYRGGKITDDKKLIVDAVKSLLVDKNSPLKKKEGFEYLKSVGNMTELDRLSEDQYMKALNHIKGNLIGVVESWANFKGLSDQTVQQANKKSVARNQIIKKQLLPEILVKNTTPAEFTAKANEIVEKIINEENLKTEASKKRLEMAFASEAPVYHEAVDFSYMSLKESIALIKKTDFKPEELNQKTEYANVMWDQIYNSLNANQVIQVHAFIGNLFKSVKAENKRQKLVQDATLLQNVMEKYNELREEVVSKAIAEMGEKQKKKNKKAQIYKSKNAVEDINYLRECLSRDEIDLTDIEDMITELGMDEKTKKKNRKAADITAEYGISLDAFLILDYVFKQLQENKKIANWKNFFEQFMLSSCDNEVFGHRLNYELDFDDKKYKTESKSAKAYLEHESEERRAINAKMIPIINKRSVMVGESLKKMGHITGELTQVQLQEVLVRMRPFIVGFVEVEGQHNRFEIEQNRRRFGYDSFEDLLKDFENKGDVLLRNVRDCVSKEAKSDSDKATVAEMEKIRNRTALIEDYEEGLFEPIKKLLIENQTVFANMMNMDDVGFMGYLDQLKEKAGIPLRAIQNMSGNKMLKGIYHQFVIMHEQEIMTNTFNNQKGLDVKSWEGILDKFYKDFMTEEVAGRRSIQKRIEGKAGLSFWNQLVTFTENPEALERERLDEFLMDINTAIEKNNGSITLLFQGDRMAKEVNKVRENALMNRGAFDKLCEEREKSGMPLFEKIKEMKRPDDYQTNPDWAAYIELKKYNGMKRAFFEEKLRLLDYSEFTKAISNVEALEEEFNKKYSEKRTFSLDFTHLDNLAKKKQKIEEKRRRSELAIEQSNDNYVNYKKFLNQALYQDRSPFFTQFGTEDKEAITENVAENRKKLDEELRKLKERIEVPEVVRDLVSELMTTNSKQLFKDEDFDQKNGPSQFGKIMRKLARVYRGICENSKYALQDKDKLFMLYLLHSDQDTRLRDESLSEDHWISYIYDVYQDRIAYVNTLKVNADQDMHPMLQTEYREVLSTLNMNVIMSPINMNDLSDDRKTFDRSITNRIRSYKVAHRMYVAFDEWLKEHNESHPDDIITPQEEERLRIGVRELFQEDIYEQAKLGLSKLTSENPEDTQILTNAIKEMREMLEDKDSRRYVYESTSSLGRVAYDDLKMDERTGQKSANRLEMTDFLMGQKKTFYDYVYFHSRNHVAEKFSKFSLEERKLFALALSLPTPLQSKDNLCSSRLIADAMTDKKETDELMSQVKNYILGKDFEPVINYERVMMRLKNADGAINDEMFEMAYNFTLSIQARHEQLKPKDFDALNDSVVQLHSAVSMLHKNLDENNAANNLKEFKEDEESTDANKFVKYLKKFADKDSDGPAGYGQALQKLKENKTDVVRNLLGSEKTLEGQDGSLTGHREEVDWFNKVYDLHKNNKLEFNMLMVILQDRTALDISTGAAADMTQAKGSLHVNESKRAALIDQLTSENDVELSQKLEKLVRPAHLEKAMETLFSYQLVDGVKKKNDYERKDFAEGALDRGTMIDWSLLKKAFALLEDIRSENNRIKMCRLAREHVLDAKNEHAKEEYKRLKLHEEGHLLDQQSFQDALISNATKGSEDDITQKVELVKAAPLIAGYNALSEREKKLFVLALQNRDVLDVSKKGLFTNRLGIEERDYVNHKGRDEVINKFLLENLFDESFTEVTNEEYTNAMKSLLSTQVDDTSDFRQLNDFASISTENRWYDPQSRLTAIDWKLFARALQFVHRTMVEREMILGDRELYRSQGGTLVNGKFVFDDSFIRRNLHKSGSRISRFLTKKAVDMSVGSATIDTILGSILTDDELYKMQNRRMFQTSNDEEEDDDNRDNPEIEDLLGDVNDKVNDLAGKVAEKAESFAEYKENETYGKYIPFDFDTDAVVDWANKVQDFTNIVDLGMKVVSNVKELSDAQENKAMISHVFKEAKNKRLEDMKREQKAAENQTEEQKKLSDLSVRNNRAQVGKIAESLVKGKINDEMIKTVSNILMDTYENEYISGVLNLESIEGVGGAILSQTKLIVATALDTLMYIRQSLREGTMLKDYYNKKDNPGDQSPFADKVEEIRQKAIGNQSTLTELKNTQVDRIKKMEGMELAQQAYGFEDMTELASFTATRIVHSILFCASNQNPNLETKAQAIAMMMALGMENEIGRQDAKVHEMLFNKLLDDKMR